MALAGEAAQPPLTGTGAVLTLAIALRSVCRFEQRNPHQAFLGRPMNVGPPGRWPTSYLPSFRRPKAATLSVVGIPSWRGIVVMRSLAPARSLSTIFLRRSR